jgi:hypothetical protein
LAWRLGNSHPPSILIDDTDSAEALQNYLD